MAKATASVVTHIRYTGGRKSHIAVAAPNGSTFKGSTIVATPVRDVANAFTWTPYKVSISADLKRLKVRLTADAPVHRATPDSGTLSITLSDPTGLPPDINPDVDPLPVDYVDDAD